MTFRPQVNIHPGEILPVLAQGVTAAEDIYRRNSDIQLLTSAARTVEATAPVLPDNFYCRGVRLVLDITVAPNTASTLTVVVDHFDPVSAAGAGRWIEVVAFTATVGSTVFGALPKTKVRTYHPDVATAAEAGDIQNTNGFVGRAWRARVEHSNSDSWTYSLGGTLLI